MSGTEPIGWLLVIWGSAACTLFGGILGLKGMRKSAYPDGGKFVDI